MTRRVVSTRGGSADFAGLQVVARLHFVSRMTLENELSRVLAADPEDGVNDELPFQTWSPMPFGRVEVEVVKDEADEPLDFLILSAG